jgi:TolB-like protein/DNA-binding winged helix-turn-helix (wHTH) protein
VLLSWVAGHEILAGRVFKARNETPWRGEFVGRHTTYRFDDFLVDLEAWQLLRSGQPVHLEPVILKLLVYLIEHRDRLVSKQELMDTVWGQTVVSESALSKAVARLRKALGDDAAHPAYIETAYALGYRFIGAVRAAEPPAMGKRWRVAAAVAIAGVLGITLAFFSFPPAGQAPDPQPAAQISSMAVLPLENLAGDPELDYFVDGLQDVLITDLSKISGLKIISRQSTVRYRDSDKTAPDIARELNVDALVEGSALLHGDRVKVTMQLIDGATDEHLWAETYDRDLGAVLPMLSEIAWTISHEIQGALTSQAGSDPFSTRPIDPSASEAYLRGLHLMNRLTGQDLRASLGHFEQAVAIDPEFALGWGGLAGAHLMLAYYGAGPPREPVMKARAAALKALELDAGHFVGHAALGWVRLFTWDWPGAGKAFEQALRINPNHATTWHGYADYLMLTGRPEEALTHLRQAALLNPNSALSNLPVPFHLYLMRRYDEAITELRRLQALHPEFPVNRMLMMAYWMSGRQDEAVAVFREWLTQRNEVRLLQALDHGHAAAGPLGALRAVGEELARQAGQQYVDPFRIASIFAFAEEADSAFYWLGQAMERGSLELMYFGSRPEFDILQDDPRYAGILQNLGLPQPD